MTGPVPGLRRVFSHAIYHPRAVAYVLADLGPESGLRLEALDGASALELAPDQEDAELLLDELSNRVLARSVELKGA